MTYKPHKLILTFASAAMLLVGAGAVSQVQAFSFHQPSMDIEQQLANETEDFVMRAGITNIASKKMDVSPDSQNVGQGAQDFISSMANRALSFLSNGELDEETKKSEFKALLEDSFDMNTIARFSLGTYWRVSTAQQRT